MNNLMVCVTFACLFFFSNMVHCQEVNGFQSNCRSLSTLDRTKLERVNAADETEFFSDPIVRDAYLVALNGNSTSVDQYIRSHTGDARVAAAVMLASIVKRNLPVMKEAYSPAAIAYFSKKNIWGPLTMSGSCDFGPGVTFLLTKGINPNDGTDVGAFNASLAYGNNEIALNLLNHGYRIGQNYKRCLSSKDIAKRSSLNISQTILQQIRIATCKR